MKTMQIGKHKVVIYNAIDELPIKRFHKFNKYMLVDCGIGSDLNDINTKIGNITRYINKGDNKNALVELDNMRRAMYLMSEEINIKHLSFMVLVKSVDGVEKNDLSDDAIKELLTIFGDTELSLLDRLIQSVKKKIDSELNQYFPGVFDDARAKEYHDQLRMRALLKLDSIINNKEYKFEIEEIDNYLFSFSKPKVFYGTDSAEISYDKQFNEMCLFLIRELSLNLEETTVFQFYNSFEYIKKMRK